MNRVASLAILLASLSTARADCPDRAASCMLHEEGVVLLSSSRFAEAAAKFKASIAAGPSARSYLGYSQALEGDGRIALAYEAMLAAKQLSDDELARNPNDVDIQSRNERIKYKLAELQTKIGLAWLRLPDGVPPQRLVSVQRKDESDVPAPLTHLVPVAPHQEMTAHLNDGTKVEFVADVAPGSTAAVVIPIGGGRVASGGTPPPPPPGGGVRPGGGNLGVVQPPPPPPEVPLPSMSLGMDVGFLVPNNGGLAAGVGIFGFWEKKVSSGLMLDFHVGYLHHPTSIDVNGNSSTADEGILLAGIRTQSHSALYGIAQGGVTIYSQDITDSTGDTTFSNTYPTLVLGGGLRTGGFHLEGVLVYAVNTGSAIDLPLRFMLTLGIDFVRH
jgi:hypothetical protein